jgi:uncharacterized protein (TIGR04255 family)
MSAMAKPRKHLNKAPIVEAVIDIRVFREPVVSPSTFAGLTPSIGQKYSAVESIHSFETRFGIESGRLIDPAQRRADLGWRYQAGTEVVQFRVDGFTFSKLEPYTTWEEVFGEAFRLWEVYIGLAKPAQLSRIAVRYINRMRVSGSRNISDFLEAPPMLPPPIPQILREFLTRVHVADEPRGSAAVVVQALEPQFDPNIMSLLLDIDAYHELSLAPSDLDLPALFQELRELKNEIFYASITERSVEMYQ